MSFEQRVRGTDWASLDGAYGPSNGSRPATDVPGMLMRLANGEPDEDDVLFSHVWHQGTIYPVTARVVPFLWDLLLDAEPLEAADGDSVQRVLLESLWMIHQSALRSGVLGAAVCDSTRQRLGPPAAWRFGEGRQFYQLIRIVVPEWRAEYVSNLVEHDVAASEAEWALLGGLDPIPATLASYAAERLARDLAVDTTCRGMIAVVAARATSPSPSAMRSIHAALASIRKGISYVEAHDDLHVWVPPLPAVDPLAVADEWKAEHDATVLFVGSSSVTLTLVPADDVGLLRRGVRANVTVRFVPPGIAKGQAVRLGFHPNSGVRVLEWAGGRAVFDHEGRPALPGATR